MKWLTNLDLSKNELQNARIQNLATDPSTPGLGQIYYNTAVNKFMGYNGTSFIDLGQVLDGSAIVSLINACTSLIDDDNLSTNVADAITKKHSHTNYTTLNAIEEAFTTALKSKLDAISAGANKITSSATNGKIKVDGVDMTVYTHPSGTNPHGTTKSDVGLGSVDNKSSLTIRSEITSSNVTDALGYTPVKNGGIPEIKKGLDSTKPSATGTGMLYITTDTKKILQDTAIGTWTQIGGQDLPPATTDTLGGIKIGANLSITPEGILSGNSNPASYIIHEEEFTITGGNTLFNLTKGTYDIGRNALEVSINGIRFPNRVITETSSSSFSIPSGLSDGTTIFVRYMQTINITPYPVHADQHLPGGVDVIPDATTSSHGLMSDTMLIKLNGIATNANNYTHPSAHAPSMITQDANNRFVTDAEKTAWNAKQPAGAYLTGNQNITVSGDATGSGTTSIALTLKNVGTSGIQNPKVTTDAQGRVTSSSALVATDIPTLTHDKISDFDTGVRTNTLNQMAVPTSDVSMNGKKLVNVGAPTSGTDGVNKDYVDAARAGLSIKDPVRVASTANVNITTGGLLNIDGVTLVAGDRVLLKDQSTPSQNGIYIVASGAWARGAGSNTSAEMVPGSYVWVNEGTVNGDSRWVLTSNGPITLDTTALTFTKDFQASDIVAGSGMTKSGNQLDIIGTANRITANADNIDIASNYAGQTSINTVGTITSGTWQSTDIGIAYGGTGASDAASARANLGAAAKGANSDITSLTGLTTDLSVSQGGTGASSATGARANLGAIGKYAVNIGDGASTFITVNHGLNTSDVTILVKEVTSPYNQVMVDTQGVDVNNIKLLFSVAPTVNQYRVVVTG